MSDQVSPYPRIWLLLGERVGDNNQLLALAEEMGLPFETRSLHHNFLRNVARRQLSKTMLTITTKSLRQLQPPWPDLVIGIGRRSVPVARWVKKRSGGAAKLVRVGNPRCDPSQFDLVITTPQYPVPGASNVLVLPMTMSRFRDPPAADGKERAWFDALPRPHLLFAIGGVSNYWDMPPAEMAQAAVQMVARAKMLGGSLIVAGSRRTDPLVMEAIAPVLGEVGRIVDASGPRFAVLLDDADEVFVTADSVSMLSEAIIAKKPVGMVPVALNAHGKAHIGDDEDPPLSREPRRDLRKFWDHLRTSGQVGTVEEPKFSPAENPVEVAARAVRALIGC